MDNKKFFAQLGVFVLVGVNVAAYCYLWPRLELHSAVTEADAAPAPGGEEDQEMKPPAPRGAVDPPEVKPPAPMKKPVLADVSQPSQIVIPLPPAPSEDAKIRERLELLKLQTADLVSFPARSEEHTMSLQDRLLAVKDSRWIVKTAVVGAQTQVIAQLRHNAPGRAAIEFKALADRVEMKSANGALEAVGNVTFAGAGLRGSCQRLTLPLAGMRIVCADKVEIANDRSDPPGCVLRGDNIAWDMSAIVGAGGAKDEMRPATFKMPAVFPSPVLGAPR